MNKKDLLTKILAIAGTILAWLPILAPVLLSAVVIIQERIFLFDYLMPAELFPLALLGGGLLVWASLRARSRLAPIAWGLGLSIGLLVGSQLLAVVTGLASGEREPAGFWWLLLLAMIAAYSLTLILTGVGGALLLKDLFAGTRPPVEKLG